MAEFGRYLKISKGDEDKLKVEIFSTCVSLKIDHNSSSMAELYFRSPVQVIKFCENAMGLVEAELLKDIEKGGE